jgi:hypothetical protein
MFQAIKKSSPTMPSNNKLDEAPPAESPPPGVGGLCGGLWSGDDMEPWKVIPPGAASTIAWCQASGGPLVGGKNAAKTEEWPTRETGSSIGATAGVTRARDPMGKEEGGDLVEAGSPAAGGAAV